MGKHQSISMSALKAPQANLVTTNHNITNADTFGYSLSQSTESGFIGRGVSIASIAVHNQLLATQLLQAQTQSSQFNSHHTRIQQIDNLLADHVLGLSPALHDFFNSVNNLAANPASVSCRQAMIRNAEALTSRFHSLDQRLSEIHEGTNTEISSSISKINSLAKQISELNRSLLLAENAAGGQPPGDRLDQRNVLVNELTRQINTDVVKQHDGTYNIFIGSNQALVIGNQSMSLKPITSSENLKELTIGIDNNGQTIPLSENLIEGTSLGSILNFRNETLNQAQNSLDRVAFNLARAFNDQHRLGQDLRGNTGNNFFSVPPPQVFSSVTHDPTSSITVDISDVSALTTSDYRLSFDGVNYTLTRIFDNTSISTTVAPSAGTPMIMDGISISDATINATEKFFIQPTLNGAKNIAVNIADINKIATVAPLHIYWSNQHR